VADRTAQFAVQAGGVASPPQRGIDRVVRIAAKGQPQRGTGHPGHIYDDGGDSCRIAGVHLVSSAREAPEFGYRPCAVLLERGIKVQCSTPRADRTRLDERDAYAEVGDLMPDRFGESF
jgi:hypothetical protein